MTAGPEAAILAALVEGSDGPAELWIALDLGGAGTVLAVGRTPEEVATTIVPWVRDNARDLARAVAADAVRSPDVAAELAGFTERHGSPLAATIADVVIVRARLTPERVRALGFDAVA